MPTPAVRRPFLIKVVTNGSACDALHELHTQHGLAAADTTLKVISNRSQVAEDAEELAWQILDSADADVTVMAIAYHEQHPGDRGIGFQEADGWLMFGLTTAGTLAGTCIGKVPGHGA